MYIYKYIYRPPRPGHEARAPGWPGRLVSCMHLVYIRILNVLVYKLVYIYIYIIFDNYFTLFCTISNFRLQLLIK